MTNKQLKVISTIGVNTLSIYLLHAFILKYIRYKQPIFIYTEVFNILIAIVLTIGILILFGNILTKNNIKRIYQEYKKQNVDVTS